MNDLIFRVLIIENFKSFIGRHEFILDREPGLYYISGNNLVNPELGANGVGKSTIWDALSWIITGHTIRDSRPANSIVPWSVEKETTSGTLTFIRGNVTHDLCRTKNPNGLMLDGGTVEQPVVYETLGLPEEMIRRTVILGQFGTMFLDLGPEEQSRMFNDALNLDVWLRASKAASDERGRLKGTIDNLDSKLSRIDGTITSVTQSLEAAKKNASTYQSIHIGRLAEAKKQVNVKSSELRSFVDDNPLPNTPKTPAVRGRGKPVPKPVTVADREVAVKAQETARTGLARQLRDTEFEYSGLAAQNKETVRELEGYVAALTSDRKCPACGQTAPAHHINEKIKALRTKTEGYNRAIQNAGAEIDRLDGLIQELNNSITGQHNRIKFQKDLEDAVASAQRDLAWLEGEVNPYTATVDDLIKRLAAHNTENKKLKADREAVEQDVIVCTYWVDSFKSIRLSLIDEILLELEMAVTRHLTALGMPDWGIQFATEKVKQNGAVSNKFTINLFPPNVEEPIRFESYSGGESQRLQLAVAFGLSDVILTRAGIEPNITVLDEPTRGLSPEGVDDLLTHLSNRAKELEHTIFVVEHHSLAAGMFDHVIVVEKTNEGSRIIE